MSTRDGHQEPMIAEITKLRQQVQDLEADNAQLQAVIDEMSKFIYNFATHKDEVDELANGTLALSVALRYIDGICDRGGFGESVLNAKAIQDRILGYVKQLEADNDRLYALISRADAAFEDARLPHPSVIDRDTLLEWNAAVVRGQELLDKKENTK